MAAKASATEINVAIIGAGSAGMAMTKQLQVASARFQARISFTIFERRSNVGGIWQYDEPQDPGQLARESRDGELVPLNEAHDSSGRLRYGTKGTQRLGPMFEGLRTNISSDLMSYRDSPFPPGTSLFPDRQTIQSYLEDYAKKHSIFSRTRFGTSVTCLKKDPQRGDWVLTSAKDGDDANETVERYSHVALCHGRCNTPNIPQIPGIETFRGRVMHSAWYRDPSQMTEKSVLVVGNASSGMDICRELVGYLARTLPSGLSPSEWEMECKKRGVKVYSSWHSLDQAPGMDYNPLDPKSPDWCHRINVVDQIDSIDEGKIMLRDGRVLEDVELIIFATGYLFDNPFLDQSTEPFLFRPLLPPSEGTTRRGLPSPSMYNVDDWFIFHCQDESIAVLGLPVTVVPFPFAEAQATYIVHRWFGLASPLPLLDSDIPANDPARWSSHRKSDIDDHPSSKELTLRTTSHTFGHPSEMVYVDSLMSFLQAAYPEAGTKAPWEQDYSSDGLGNGDPKGPEGHYATTQWRRERRTNGKVLRREILGY